MVYIVILNIIPNSIFSYSPHKVGITNIFDMSSAFLSEVKNLGRPAKKSIGAAHAYSVLYPEATKGWKELLKAKEVSKELMLEVEAKKAQLNADKDKAIADWDAAHPDIAVKYNEYRSVARVRDKARREAKKLKENAGDEQVVNEDAIRWEKKYYALLERSTDTTNEITTIFKKNNDGVAGSAANEAILISQNNALQADLSDAKDTISIINKKLDKKRSIIADLKTKNHSLEKQVRTFKKQRIQAESDDESSSD